MEQRRAPPNQAGDGAVDGREDRCGLCESRGKMSAVTTDIRVPIPAFNDPPRILDRVVAAVRADARGVPIVVVDMSPDDALAAVSTRHDDVRWVHFPDSGGVAESRNRLAHEAGTRYVVYLDSDAF